MKDKSTAITTQALWARLFEAPTLDTYFMQNGDTVLPTFSEYISELAATRGEKPEAVLRRGNIESSFGHRLFSGARNPGRDTVLQMAFGFGMTADETQQLLEIARATALHPKVKRDAIIAFCLHNGKTIVETQQLLHESDLPLLGGGNRVTCSHRLDPDGS